MSNGYKECVNCIGFKYSHYLSIFPLC